ncbi:hypothetical protein [Polyangium aurulentum]|uniref:hypothetical protein n=1 Tax=Polyangium aurulentum TaxID=2567896 RepID=UPI00197FB40D|nr:hypothetical protein [Polyangium aurulentum]UQA57685.1 hypothetical protein E8A73_041460 [Polyangium aurulentum]
MSIPNQKPFAARRALIHPLWLGALALLAINDHLLKGSGHLPGWLTGKLSDFAGLVVAPALLATLLRLSSRKALLAAHVATGAVFAAIKIFPDAARAFEALTALTPFPWEITVDPTDLAALPALAVAFRVLVPAMARPLPERPVAYRIAAIGGSLACAATSEPQEPCTDPVCNGTVPEEFASLVLGNQTSDQRLVRVRPLKESVQVECAAVLADPEHNLSRELFGPAETWLLDPGRALPLQNNACAAYLVDADGMEPTLLAWSASEFPTQAVSTATDSSDPNRTIIMQLGVDGKLALAEHPAVFPAPPIESEPASAQCKTPDVGVGVDWSEPLPGPHVLQGIDSSPDGCHALKFEAEAYYLCVPEAAIPFKAGDLLDIQELPVSGGAFPEAGATSPLAEVLRITGPTHTVLVVRGSVLARHELAKTAEPLSEPTIEAKPLTGCSGARVECGGLSMPLDISILGDHVSGVEFIRAGGTVTLADGYGTLHVVRAEAMPVRDTACPPFPVSDRHYESVLVIPTAP